MNRNVERFTEEDITRLKMEAGKVLNPSLATLCKWAEMLGQKLQLEPLNGLS